MKKILSLAMALMMLCLAAAPVFAADTALPENCETTHYVIPTDKAPTIDGKITAEEWGEADFVLNKSITKGQRTYCRDYFSGNGNLITDMTCNWSYDADNFYLAFTFVNPEYNAGTTIGKSYTQSVVVNMGKFNTRMTIADGAITGAPAEVKVVMTADGSTKNVEMAIPRSLTGTETELQGYIADDITVDFVRADESTGKAQVITNTTPVYADAKKTHDLFVLAESAQAVEDAQKAAEAAKRAEVLKYHTEIDLVKAAKAPVIDGKISDGEYGDPYMVSKEGDEDRLRHMANIEQEAGPDVTFYWTWDDKYMYVAAVIDSDKFVVNNKLATDTKAPSMYVYLLDGDGIELGATKWQDFHAIHFTNLFDDGAGLKASTWFSASSFPNVATGGQSAKISGNIADRSEAGMSEWNVIGEGEERQIVWEVAYDWTKITMDGKAPVAGDKYTIHFQFTDDEGQFRLGYNVEDTNTQGYTVATLVNSASAPSTPSTPSTPSAPATFDAGIIALVVAAAAGAGVVVSKKRR